MRMFLVSYLLDLFKPLQQSFKSWVLELQAIGHGISSSILDELCEFTKGFFELPKEEKQRYSKAVGGFQGYGSDAIVSEEQVLDWTDRLYLVVYPEDKKELQVWPEKPNSLKEVLHEYTEKTKLVLKLLLKAMAKSLNLDEDCFLNQFGKRAALEARFNYYPYCSRPGLVFGVKRHSDVTALTTILQDKVEGLQVLKDGQWSTVPIVPHTILIFIGDQMEIMSNGTFKGVVHRVVTNTERARLSLAVFHKPEQEKEIEPLNGLIDDKKPKLYKKVKNYSDLQFPNFLLGKPTIDSAKV